MSETIKMECLNRSLETIFTCLKSNREISNTAKSPNLTVTENIHSSEAKTLHKPSRPIIWQWPKIFRVRRQSVWLLQCLGLLSSRAISPRNFDVILATIWLLSEYSIRFQNFNFEQKIRMFPMVPLSHQGFCYWIFLKAAWTSQCFPSRSLGNFLSDGMLIEC